MTRVLSSRVTKIVVWLACLAPLALLLWQCQHRQLGVNWLEAAQRRTGDWVLRFLLFTLLITPLRRVPGLNALIRYRRLLGLYAFFYGCVHLGIYLYYDKAFDWTDIRADFLSRRFYSTGLIAWALMVPLALTSTTWAIRKLKRRWVYLHRLIYVSAAAGALHYYRQGKSIVPRAVVYAGCVTALLLYRAIMAITRARRLAASPAYSSSLP